MLKEKYQDVLDLGSELEVRDGFVEEADGRLKIGGVAAYQYDKDRLWDAIKAHDGWEDEVEAQIEVANRNIYGVYTVKSGDTLGQLSQDLLGRASRYMDIFNLNTDQLKDPNRIKVGQKLKLPNP